VDPRILTDYIGGIDAAVMAIEAQRIPRLAKREGGC
jgi:hypothetical protein